jgi:hypothetical protein
MVDFETSIAASARKGNNYHIFAGDRYYAGRPSLKEAKRVARRLEQDVIIVDNAGEDIENAAHKRNVD